MTYGTLMIILIIACLVFASGYFISIKVIKYRIYKQEKRVEILNKMIDFNIQYMKMKIENQFSEFPCIDEYLGRTVRTITKTINSSDYSYENIKIGTYENNEKWMEVFFSELKKVDNQIKELIDFNINLTQEVFKYKTPIKFIFHTFKKKAEVQILYCVIAICKFWMKKRDRGSKSYWRSVYSVNQSYNKLQNKAIKKSMDELEVAA